MSQSNQIKRLGVLTGGGDVPGLNAAIKALVLRGAHMDISFTGIRKGWEGIAFLNPYLGLSKLTFVEENPETWKHGYTIQLGKLNTRIVDRMGGTFLQSTRTNPANTKVSELPAHLASYGNGLKPDERVDLTKEVIANLEFLRLDGLVVIGGDDTLSYGARLAKEGVPVWGIPKTMDNDVPGTDYCIGFQTAISRATEKINRIRSTAGSHSETVIFRIFGRDAGFTAFETSIASFADRCLIPEVPSDIDTLVELVKGDRKNPRSYSIIVMSEGANLGMPVPEMGPADAYGHREKVNVAKFLADKLAARLPDIRFLPNDLTYELRSGEPDAYDKRMAIFYANLVMSFVGKGKSGVIAAHRYGRFIGTDIPDKNHSARRLDPADYHPTRYRPLFEQIIGEYEPQE
jgi:ATP-dependent phosphofructokinase / diphosphate-dependent phosphofructokinase